MFKSIKLHRSDIFYFAPTGLIRFYICYSIMMLPLRGWSHQPSTIFISSSVNLKMS